MNNSAIKDEKWRDITSEFMASISQLNLGELLSSEYFTLLEAMSAIELMDPRMDSGMMLKKCNKTVLNLEQSVKLGLVKLNDLHAHELIGIIDDTYACLTTWFDGNLLAQTVMTNLYLHDTERIEDRTLRIFCQSILKIVSYVDELIQVVFCIEEEDFALNGNVFNLASGLNDSKVLNALDDVCRHFETIIKPERSTSSSNKSTTKIKKNPNETQENGQDENKTDKIQANKSCYEKKYTIAILSRLRFTYHLCASLNAVSKTLSPPDLNSQTDTQLQKFVKLVQQSILTIESHMEKCHFYIEQWASSIDLGAKPKEKTKDIISNHADYPTIMGFEPLINHKLLPSGYPRCPSIKTRIDAIEHLRNLTIKLKRVVFISKSFSQRSYRKSVESIEEFSKYFEPHSCAITRSLLLALYVPFRCTNMLKDDLLQSMSEYCEPALKEMRKHEAASIALDDFLNENSNSLYCAISVFGHNTARQHERLSDIILSFRSMQYSAFLINSAFGTNFLYSWITCYLFRICIKYVLAGLELELFSAHEYPYVFWYLQEILYPSEREQLEYAQQYIINYQDVVDESQKKSKTKKHRKKSIYTTTYHDKCLMCNEAYRNLTSGLFLLTHGLRIQNMIKSPMMNYTTEEICFDHRFAAITSASVFQSYRNTLARLPNLESTYKEALKCFARSISLFEAIGDQEECLKVSKTNTVVTRILSTNSDSFANRRAEFSFDIHRCFPTVKF